LRSLAHDQVFRKYIWGRMCKSAASGPRLYAVIRTDMASASSSSLAYYQSAHSSTRQIRKAYLDKDVPVPILIKDIGVHQFEFRDIPTSVLVLLLDLLVWESRLGVLVQEFHVGVSGSRVEVPVHFLDIFSVISCISAPNCTAKSDVPSPPFNPNILSLSIRSFPFHRPRVKHIR
jgi:hypothetical protein